MSDDSAASSHPSWASSILDQASLAPDWVRALAAPALHIGGFTNVQLQTPVLDLPALQDEAKARLALVFFLATALAAQAPCARVRCARSPLANEHLRHARRSLRGAIERIDGDNLTLMRYFDVYLKPAGEISSATGRRIAREFEVALFAEPGSKHGHQE